MFLFLLITLFFFCERVNKFDSRPRLHNFLLCTSNKMRAASQLAYGACARRELSDFVCKTDAHGRVLIYWRIPDETLKTLCASKRAI